ncbi:MAG: hypothetical protein IJO48_02650 [Clostridia bacterium]|nr:hypothetical protein [Clostridia bacterium]
MDTEEKITDLLQKLTEIDTKLDSALARLDDHESRIRSLENIPARRWDMLLSELIGIVAASAIGLLIGKII